MTDAPRPEGLISTNAILLFLFVYLGVNMVDAHFLHWLINGPGTLRYTLFGLVSAIAYIACAPRPSWGGDRRRFLVAAVFSSLLLVGLTVRQIQIRGPAHGPDGIFDGALQSEIAAGYLLHGVDPYGADYRHTAYQTYNPSPPGAPAINIVWFHYIYPPLTFLAFVPLRLVSSWLGAWSDYRWLTVGSLFAITAALWPLARSWSARTRVVLLTIGNPILWTFAISGTNDSLAILWLILVALMMSRRRWWWAGVMMGLACASKQSAWLAVPLWGYWLWLVTKNDRRGLQRGLRGWAATTAIFFGPFVLWHPARMFTDLVRYASGSLPFAYPISGATFLQYLYIYRFVPSPWSLIPTYLFQILVGLPTLWLTARWIRWQPTASRWLTASAVLTLMVLIFSRYNNNNYVAALIMLLIGAWFFERQETNPTISAKA